MVKAYVKQNNTTYKIDDVRKLLNNVIERVRCKVEKTVLSTSLKKKLNLENLQHMDELIDQIVHRVLTITGETILSDI